MAKSKVLGIDWRMDEIWNDTLDKEQDRPMVARNYIWASELGGSFMDRYLRMNAVPYTNPPNARSRRKFTAGKIWEWTLGMVFISANILKKTQARVESQLPGLLRVSGKIDFLVGGEFDYDSAKKKIEEMRVMLNFFDLEIPPFFFNAADNFVEKYRNKILIDKIYEAKTLSSFMMEKVQRVGAMKHHVSQNYHYIKYNDIGIRSGVIGYICKDDCIMKEEVVYDSDKNAEIYQKDIAQMTDYYNAGFDKRNLLKFAPPKEKEVIFDTDTLRFSTNYKVEYSPYLSLLYPQYVMPKNYQDRWSKSVASWNRTYKRCVGGDKMTALNLEAIKEAKTVFPNWDELVELGKKSGNIEEDNED